MSIVNDPIADMLTRIRNGVANSQSAVAIPETKIKGEIARILKEEGYIEAFEVIDGEKPHQKMLRLKLKYVGDRREKQSVITGLVRVSTPGRRVYTRKQQIPWVLSGIGVAILSTPKGVMTGQRARQLGVGGEILCKVW
jgi:small subunit ribosomal protein S8